MGSLAVKFPNDPGVVLFLESAKRCAGKGPYIFDALGFSKSYNELLADILRLRDLMRQRFPPSAFDQRGLLKQHARNVCLMARGGYEYIVGFFAVLSLGGCFSAMSPKLMVEEIVYLVDQTKAVCILTSPKWLDKVEKAVAWTREKMSHECIPLVVPSDTQPLLEIDIEIDETLVIPPSHPSVIAFTSGSTGKPKGVVLPRTAWSPPLQLNMGAECACFRPPHWLGGLVCIVVPVMQGSKLHVPSIRATGKEIWQVFLNNRITSVSLSPWTLRCMQEYVSTLSSVEQERHFHSLKSLARFTTGGTMLSPETAKFWPERTDVPILNIYGFTEFGLQFFAKTFDKNTELTNSIGTPVKNVEVKLTEGDRGELLLRAPGMMTHYLNDEERTRAAFDEEGYFRTGDYAEFRDGEYFYLGRLSVDHIHYRDYDIPAVVVELALSTLPYVSDVCIVGVDDYEERQLCAAVIRLTSEAQANQWRPGNRITLPRISEDVRHMLPAYMHPRLLHLIESWDELPLTDTQKPKKRQIVKQFFGANGVWDREKAAPGVEHFRREVSFVEGESKPWDWNALQYL